MTTAGDDVARALDDLRAIHEQSWDPDIGLVRFAPGAVPDLDLATLDLHSIRESAAGAYLDLADGQVERASRAIESVLDQQYLTSGRVWTGTFKVTAEQAEPPAHDAIEWLHYDPNWRQFLGTMLALIVEDHAGRLDATLVARMGDAIAAAVDGEPADRIPEWYTNPDLMHAWLTAWSGRRRRDDDLVAAGTARAHRIVDRLRLHGDIDEYNSPSYDGLDLYSAALWVSMPPSPPFAAWGRELIEVIGRRVSVLFQPALHAVCGPHLRAYGLDLTRYVSLVGLWLLLAGEQASGVTPSPMDRHTVHVHDLYFLPLFQRLAPSVLPALRLDRPLPRRHHQRFGQITAMSDVAAHRSLGAERGRRADFAADQYVPVTAHALADGRVHWLGMKLGPTTTHIDAEIVDGDRVVAGFRTEGADTTDLCIISSGRPEVDHDGVRVGPIQVRFDMAPAEMDTADEASGIVTTLTFGTNPGRVVLRTDV